MAVWYLDNDDEITDAVARLRGTEDERVVFVVPPGSRIATGRINFKLLAREAESRALTLAVASPDEQVRALASAAGVLARPTPDEAEAALERGDQPEVGAPPAAPSTTTVAAVAPSSDRGASLLAWRSQRVRLASLVSLALLIVAGFLVTTTLPTAEVTLTPRISDLGPFEVLVTASADTTDIDPSAGAVPATALAIPLQAEITHPSSGQLVTETKATGSVTFTSASQDSEQEIGAGTRVETPAGIAFRTTRTVVLPPSEEGLPAQVTAPVEAVVGGETGNVAPGRISVAPSLQGQDISVSNPEATSGGATRIAPLVEPGDYDDAVENLENLLRGKLKAFVEDPVNTPAGLTVFAETRALGPLRLEPAADEVVGDISAELTLSGSAAAQVLAVDEAQVDALLRALIETGQPPGSRLLPESVDIRHEAGVAEGDRIGFDGFASASVTPVIDVEALAVQIAGLPVSEAQAILDGLGQATVNVWPGFLGDLPNDRERITLDVLEASATE